MGLMGIYCNTPELCGGCQSTTAQIHTETGPYQPVCPDCFRKLKEKAESHFLAGFLFALAGLALGATAGYLIAGGKL